MLALTLECKPQGLVAQDRVIRTCFLKEGRGRVYPHRVERGQLIFLGREKNVENTDQRIKKTGKRLANPYMLQSKRRIEENKE